MEGEGKHRELSEFGQEYGEVKEVKVSRRVESKMPIFCFMIFASVHRASKVSDVCCVL